MDSTQVLKHKFWNNDKLILKNLILKNQIFYQTNLYLYNFCSLAISRVYSSEWLRKILKDKLMPKIIKLPENSWYRKC